MDEITLRDWLNHRVDDLYGARVGKVKGVYLDRDRRTPVWLLARMTGPIERHAAIPLDGATMGGGRVWVPHERSVIRSSPALRIDRPLSPQHEHQLCEHYGMPLTRGARAASWERRSLLIAMGDPEDPDARQAINATRAPGGRERRTAPARRFGPAAPASPQSGGFRAPPLITNG